MTLRWGLLSTALINDRIIDAARSTSRADVVAVASRDAERAAAYARERGIDRAHGAYEALLEDPGVDAVYISLPNGMHVEWTLRALEAGKHVLVEKPFSPDVESVVQSFDAADARGLILSEGFMWRHQPQTAELIRLVGEGAIGPLRLVRAAFSFPLEATRGAADTRFDPALEGGALMDVGTYCVNAIRAIAGEPEHVAAEQVVGRTGVDVVFTAALRCPDDVVTHFDCAFVLSYRAALEVAGEDGSLFVADPWHAHEPGIELRRGDGLELLPFERTDAYRLELENIADAVAGDVPLLLGRDDAVGQARVLEALYRSARMSTPLEVSQ
ncbi:MAG TPA: Gfo/Idh/MocA family oxidoreductase [Gaiellaceae bacterium]|nr:Gfo/Idh/MocA family oxidoreductase [Gaiellaceae bacterium]